MGNELNKLLEKSFDFLTEMIQLSRKLASLDNTIISKSLLQCSTNIIINIHEAIEFNASRSSKGKLAKASENAGETLYWLKRIEKEKIIEANFPDYISNCQNIIGTLLASSNS